MKTTGIIIFILLSFTILGKEVILVNSDSQVLTDYKTIVPQMEREKPDYVFMAGDNVQSGNSQLDWEEFLKINEGLIKITGGKFYSAIGNHELNAAKFYQNFPKASKKGWYSIETDDVYFILINSNLIKPKDIEEQTLWIEDELKKAKESKKFIALILHHPIYSLLNTANKNIKKQILPLLEKYKVDIVFQGHEHKFEKIKEKETVYLVVGGYLQKEIKNEDISEYAEKNKITYETSVENNKIKKVRFSNGVKIVDAKHYVKLITEENKLIVEIIDENNGKIDEFEIKH